MTPYRTEKRPDHPMAMADGKVYVHRRTLYDKIGPGPHPCHWCHKEVEWAARGGRIVADHLNGDRWDNCPENLVPSCDYCNHARSRNPKFLTVNAVHALVSERRDGVRDEVGSWSLQAMPLACRPGRDGDPGLSP